MSIRSIALAMALSTLISSCFLVGCKNATKSSDTTKVSRYSSDVNGDNKQALFAAANALDAIKMLDVASLKTLLFSKGSDYWMLERKGRELLDKNSERLGLGQITAKELELSMNIIPDVSRQLLEDLSLPSVDYSDGWEPDKQRLAAIKCKLPNSEKCLLIIMIEEDGMWKMVSFPVFSTNMLKYDRLLDATNDQSVLY